MRPRSKLAAPGVHNRQRITNLQGSSGTTNKCQVMRPNHIVHPGTGSSQLATMANQSELCHLEEMKSEHSPTDIGQSTVYHL